MDQEQKCKVIYTELLNTEHQFNSFMNHFRGDITENGLITKESDLAFLEVLDLLVAVHEKFAAFLEENVGAFMTEAFIERFNGFVDEMADHHVAYSEMHAAAVASLASNAPLVEEINKSGLSVEGILVCPLSRLARYSLLFQEMIKHDDMFAPCVVKIQAVLNMLV
eukprot:TRINITY_DN2000_c0_g1_i2.p1 TRINITY_DN2000_c0_g1~~TRINITY_DN2000_c0_g1_i2.p1  ORF type:complete len:166 (-),score=36.19 TRINITY_DN2000_c0_g1_i2:619-1116(-)